ncbi:methyltransferase domain-containing protein [bacterium]|nr:methyltransferase domain-containing protein [bacterium]
MFNCSWQKFLGVFLILSSLGCAQFYNLPDKKKSTNPVNLNTVETRRINKKKPDRLAEDYERRDSRADSEKEFQEVEKVLITYLEATDQDKKWMIPELKKSMSYIDSHAKECPGYLPFINVYIKIQTGLLSEVPFEDKLDIGVYNYITERKDLASVVKDMRQYRSGKTPKYVPISHICSGIFHHRHFLKQKDIVNSVTPLSGLKGKTVVDIGGGSGGLLAELSESVIDKDSGAGKTILVEIEPSLLEFAKYMGKYDKRFAYAELRLCESHDGINDPALKANEADLVCLFDVHNLYDKFNESISEEEKFKRGAEYLAKIKNGMKMNGILLVYDSESMSCSADKVKQMAEKAGLQAEIKSTNLDKAVNPGAIKYLVVCRRV